MNDHDRRVFKRALWLESGPVAKSVWPILAIILPLIFDLVMAWLDSRVRSADSTDDPTAELRRITAGHYAPWRARAAWENAEADVRRNRA